MEQITRLDAYTGPSQVALPLTEPLSFVTLQLAGTVNYVPPAAAILSILDTITVAGPQSVLYGILDTPTFAPASGTYTNVYGELIQIAIGGAGTVTNATGLEVVTPTGATNNYTAIFGTGAGAIVGIATANAEQLERLESRRHLLYDLRADDRVLAQPNV